MVLLSPYAPDSSAVNRTSVPISISQGLAHMPLTIPLSLATGAFNTCSVIRQLFEQYRHDDGSPLQMQPSFQQTHVDSMPFRVC